MLVLLGVVAPLVGCGVEATSVEHVEVAFVVDGDTVELAGGTRVRLLQVDAPEGDEGECFADEASAELRRLLPAGARIGLEIDPALDRVDRFGRLLRYVRRGGRLVNLALVEGGFATPYFFGGERGEHAGRLLDAAERARAARRGLWAACPRTRLEPDSPADTGHAEG